MKKYYSIKKAGQYLSPNEFTTKQMVKTIINHVKETPDNVNDPIGWVEGVDAWVHTETLTCGEFLNLIEK